MSNGPFVVLNADDFGISSAVDDEILRLHERGLITSTTLLVNGPSAEEAIKRAPRSLGVGIHLDTSEFDALTAEFAACRSDRPDLDVRTARHLPLPVIRAIGAEWIAQVETARSMGLEPTHVDSHHFDHVNPLLVPELRRLRRSSGVSRVRGMHNLWRTPPSRAVRVAKSMHRAMLRLAGFETTDFMCDAGTFVELTKGGGLPETGSIEVMVHPGHPGYDAETARLEAAIDQVSSMTCGRFDEFNRSRALSRRPGK